MLELLILIGLVVAGSAAALAAGSAASPERPRTVRLTFPRGVRPEQGIAFARSVNGLLAPWWRRWLLGSAAVTFEIQADDHGIVHRLVGPAGPVGYLLAQLAAAMPGVRIVDDGAPRPDVRTAAELRLSSSSVPVRTDQPAATSAGILASLQPLREGERVVLQWIVSPLPAPRLGRVPIPSLVGELTLGAGNVRAGLPIDQARAEREKHSEPLAQAVCRLGVAAGSVERERFLLRGMLGAFHATNAPGVSFRRRLLPDRLIGERLRARSAPSGRWPITLNAKELAAVVGVPLGDTQLPGLTLGATRQLAPAADVPHRGRVVGRATFPGAERAVALSVADSLRHLHALGPTGVGKSTLLLNLITGDMRAGRGVIVVDPKGDLAEDVLARVPTKRAGDVILLDPSDTERPLGFNLLGGNHGSGELIADQVVSIFRGLFSAFWGPRTDDILRASLLTLAGQPGMTLAEVPALLSNDTFRRRLVGGLDDVVLEGFWSWFESLSPGERAQAVGPVLNKLRTFLLRKRLRNVIGQADSSFSMEAVLAEQKILIVSLQKGLIGEDAAALLGSCVLARLWQSVQGRAALPAAARRPVFCFVDEFQDYLNLPTSLADVLAQARAYGLGLTLAHQHLGQLPSLVRHAVLANARSKVVFQAAAADAAALAKEFAPYLDAADLQSLGPYEAIFQAAAGNRVAPPTTIAALPPPEPTGQTQVARELSRLRRLTDRRVVVRRLTDRRVVVPLDRQVGGVRAGSAGTIYALDAAGQRLASACGPAGGLRIRRPWTPGSGFLAHHLAVSELYVGLRERERAGDADLLDFDSEPLCWRTFTGLGGARQVLKPDAFARLGLGDYEDRYFIEVDRATQSGPAIARKLLGYRRYFQAGREQERFGVFPKVLILAPSESRKAALVDVLGGQPAGAWELFQVAIYADALDVLTGRNP